MSKRASLPHSDEAERAVLAAILLDPSNAFAQAASRLSPGSFFVESHQRIFEAATALIGEGVDVDIRTVQAWLEARAHEFGGVAYLAGLDVDLPDLGRLDSYVGIVVERATRRALIAQGERLTRECLDGAGVDALEAATRAQSAIGEIVQGAVPATAVPAGDAVQVALLQIEEAEPGGASHTFPTGISSLDRRAPLLARGWATIIAGRPGSGKTTFVMQAAKHGAIKHRRHVLVFSYEMSAPELGLKLASDEAGVPYGPLQKGHLTQAQWERLFDAQKRIAAASLRIDDTAPTFPELLAAARRAVAENRLDILVIDYLQLLESGKRYENRNLEIGFMSRQLKRFAMVHGVSVVVLSQLSRDSKRRGGDGRPHLHDLRDSGAIEQDADVVLFTHRPDGYDDPSNPSSDYDKRKAEAICAKHRRAESSWSVPLDADFEHCRFRALAPIGPAMSPVTFANLVPPPSGPAPF